MTTLLSHQSFLSFTAQHPIVAVLFFAGWDQGSKMMQGQFEQLAEYFSASVSFGSVNVDDEKMWSIMSRVGIMTTPTVLVYKDGVVRKIIVGFRTKQSLMQDILAILSGSREDAISGQPAPVKYSGEPFDWNMILHLEPYSSLHDLPVDPVKISVHQRRRIGPYLMGEMVYDLQTAGWVHPSVSLFRIGTQAYVVAGDRRLGGSKEGGPFIYLYFWAPSDGAVRRAAFQDVEADDWRIAEPPSKLLPQSGCVTYQEILAQVKSHHCERHSENYIFDHEGWCIGHQVEIDRITYYFRQIKNDLSEQVYAIKIDHREK